MRKHFVTKILTLMEQDENLVFLTGDLGFGSFEVIQEMFPDRFYNMGIAEQNMMGVACGLSLVGKKVIIYSIGNFSTLRVIEQIRNYPIYHQCQVLIVNGGGAFSYGQLGYTHHAVEDVSMMKSIPHLRVFAPFDQITVEEAIDKWYVSHQTAYLRLEKADAVLESPLKKHTFGYLCGNPKVKNFIISYGTITEEAISAQLKLAENSIETSVIVLNELKKVDETLYELVDGADKVLFLEENATQGGMGEHFFAMCMVNNIKIEQAKICGVKDYISETIGDQKYLRGVHLLTAAEVVVFFNHQ